jgi:hypothetical protein
MIPSLLAVLWLSLAIVVHSQSQSFSWGFPTVGVCGFISFIKGFVLSDRLDLISQVKV